MQVRNPIEELHSSRVYKYLETQDIEYARRITNFVRQIAPILATTANYFPYYTRHDAHHGFRVTERIAQILTPECLHSGYDRSLCASEVFLLISAAYAHDLGMTVFPGEEEQLITKFGLDGTEDWEISSTLQEYLRRNHSKRGGEYIFSNADVLNVPVSLVGALDLMMKSHNFSIAELDQELREPFAAQERVIDVRQLAVILCIADAVEFSDTRVVDGVLDRVKADDSTNALVSYRENMKHICIGDSLAIETDGRVIVSGTFSDPDVLSLAHHTFDQMEDWVKGYCDIDRRSTISRLKVRAESFARNLQLFGARFERLGIRMNKKSVIDLIASNAVWQSNGGVSIRELVQNAVEACRYRNYHSSIAAHYQPRVSVIFDRSDGTVTVLDNGCGMSERVVLNNFLTVGNSRSRETAYANADYAPIARFGIGFWSVFTITEKAHIETATFEELRRTHEGSDTVQGIAFDVALDELKDYTVFLHKELPCGTKVVLHLKPGVIMDDVFDQVRRHLLCSEVDLSLVLDGDEFQVPLNVPAVKEEDILGARQRLKDELNVQIFQWQECLGETELAIGFVYRMHQGRATFMRDEHNSLLTVLSGLGMHVQRTAVCGFQVPVRPKHLCFDLMRVGTFFSNHRTPRGFEFLIDRQQLLPNDAAQQFSLDVTNLIHDAYRSFLDTIGSKDVKSIYELNEQSAMHGGNTFDQYTGAELADAYECYSDLLCFRLYEVATDKSFIEAEVHYVNLNQLLDMKGIIWLLQNRYYIPIPGGAHQYSLDPEGPRAKEVVYEYARRKLGNMSEDSLMFVIDANRPASMLFDADPNSTVEFCLASLGLGSSLNVCIQRLCLSNLQMDPTLHGVLVEVRGRWTGAIYLRDFETPNHKPYVFLGRYRVLIKNSSGLSEHLRGLMGAGQLMRMSEVIADLMEDEAGFTPKTVAAFV